MLVCGLPYAIVYTRINRSSADTPGAGVGGLGSGGAGSTSRKSFASKNLNALTKAPAVHRCESPLSAT